MENTRSTIVLVAGGVAMFVASIAVGWAVTTRLADADQPTHDHGDHDHGDHDHGEADDGEGDRVGGHVEHGMVIHDSTGGREPTEADEAGADEFYDATVAGTERYEDLDVAIADGYHLTDPDGAAGNLQHWMREDRGEEDDRSLDPTSPEGLIYWFGDGEAELVGVVYVTREAEPEQPGGPLTLWHDHSASGTPGGRAPVAGAGSGGAGPPLMLHVWFFDGVVDRFAHDFPGAVG